jgi:glycosyltransferase involved in cell wall biosynthesis
MISKYSTPVSIIINNYNYERFLAKAINSALEQTYPYLEVVVVDDGSTDGSRDIISGFGNRIVPVLKSNGGQASCFNEGFKASKGEIVLFLDADDIFYPEKVEKIVTLFHVHKLIGSSAIFFNSLEAVDENSAFIESITTSTVYPDWSALAKIRGDEFTGGEHYFFNGEMHQVCTPDQVYAFASKYRHIPYIGMPASNISMSRVLASKIFPIPVTNFKTSADCFVAKAASLLGSVYSTDLPLTQYRIHSKNGWFDKKETQELEEAVFVIPDDYLNRKLEESGRKPVFCFLKSMGASGYYRRWFGYSAADDLIRLSFYVILFRLDFETLNFFFETITKGIYYKIKGLYHKNKPFQESVKS